MSKVSIIIPAWNLWHLTLQCLESIAIALTADALHGKVEIIVVNNGSTDETSKALSPVLARLFGEHGKEVRFSENMGFAKGCNAGARAAKHPLLFFLNNDTIVTKGFLPLLVDALSQSKNTGIVAPLLLYQDNTVQHCGIVFTPTLAPRHLYEFFPAKHPLVAKRRSFQALTGAAFLISAKLFHECDMFHEAYQNGFEDIDLCIQVRQRKLSLLCVPESIIYHITSQTPGRFDHDSQNGRLLSARCGSHIFSDMHKTLSQDGFTSKLDPILRLQPMLLASKDAALTHMFQKNFHETNCQRRLEAEPLWFQGYILLARHASQQGQWDNALNILSHLLRLAPMEEHWQVFMQAAQDAQDNDMAESAKKNLQALHEMKQNHSEHQNKAHTLYAHSLERSDTLLQKLFADWLATYER